MKALIVLILTLLLTACTSTDNQAKLAIKGYDVVAYFDKNAAVKGLSDYKYNYKGVDWQFSTPENKQRFTLSPEKYTPQYDGYCAYAMSTGSVVKSNPQAFSIVEGKLYLNYSLSIRKKWRRTKERLITKADAHWAKKRK